MISSLTISNHFNALLESSDKGNMAVYLRMCKFFLWNIHIIQYSVTHFHVGAAVLTTLMPKYKIFAGSKY